MSRLWLDWYITGSSRTLIAGFEDLRKELGVALPPDFPDLLREAEQDDGSAFRLTCEFAVRVLDAISGGAGSEKFNGSTGNVMPGVMLEGILWRSALAPFFFETVKKPLAIVLDRDVVNVLGEEHISDCVREYGRNAVEHHGIAYIDLPHHAMTLGNGLLQLRALVVTESQRGLRFYAILTGPGRNVGRRLCWFEGGEEYFDDHLDDEESVEFLRGNGRVVPSLQPLVDAIRDTDLDFRCLLADLEDFALLAITHAKTQQDGNPNAWQAVPHLPAGHPRRSGRKAAQVAKRFSLFSAWRVTARGLECGTNDGSTAGRTLGRRSTVRAHLKLQAHGPRHSLRKLIRVASYPRGPRDAVPLTPLLTIGTVAERPEVARAVIFAPPIHEEFAEVDA